MRRHGAFRGGVLTGQCVAILRGAGRGLRGVARLGLDVLLPPFCLTCDEPVAAPGQFCADCFQRTGFVTAPMCDRCGVPFSSAAQGGADGLCQPCHAHAGTPGGFDRCRAALRYDAQARKLVLPLKHGDRLDLARALAPHMARAGATLLRGAEILVPVPLHRWRLLGRRYNQAALLGREVARLSGKPALPDALIRTRRTPSLGDMPAGAREAAVGSAFAVRPRRAGAVKGRRILLIDDVMTSGATARACAEALRAAAAVGVDLLAAARVPDPRLG